MIFLWRHHSTFWQLATQSKDAAESILLPTWECQNILLTVAGQVSQPGWKTADYYYCYLQVMKQRHGEMKELAYSPLEATLRRESRKSCGWSSALCIIPFSFPKRQCNVIGVLHSVNSLQAIAHSNLTTVFFLIFFNGQHIILPLPFYTLVLSHSRFSISSLERYCFLQENRNNSADFKYKLVQVFCNEGRMLARYIGLSSIQDVLWDLKCPSGEDMERADGTSI